MKYIWNVKTTSYSSFNFYLKDVRCSSFHQTTMYVGNETIATAPIHDQFG